MTFRGLAFFAACDTAAAGRFCYTIVDAAKRAQEIADGGPQASRRVGVHFADAIAIIVARPFMLAMADCGMASSDLVIAAPFIGKDLSADQSEWVDTLTQRRLIRVANDPQPDLVGLAAHRAAIYRLDLIWQRMLGDPPLQRAGARLLILQ